MSRRTHAPTVATQREDIIMTTVWVTVEFPDIEAARAARLSSVSVSSTQVSTTDDDEPTIVYEVEIDGEPSGPAEGYFDAIGEEQS